MRQEVPCQVTSGCTHLGWSLGAWVEGGREQSSDVPTIRPGKVFITNAELSPHSDNTKYWIWLSANNDNENPTSPALCFCLTENITGKFKSNWLLETYTTSCLILTSHIGLYTVFTLQVYCTISLVFPNCKDNLLDTLQGGIIYSWKTRF